MNNTPQPPQKKPWWQRLESGQALVEYWPTLPAAVMVVISAAAVVGPIGDAFRNTADGLSGIECEVAAPQTQPTYTDLEGGHRIEVTSYFYDESTDRTTLSFKVSSGNQPSISHWVLGLDEETASRIVDTNEAYESWGLDPTTGKYGIKFDTGYEGTGGSAIYVGPGTNNGGGNGGGNKKVSGKAASIKHARIFINPYRPAFNTYVEERDIVLTFTGQMQIVEYMEVTTKAGSDQVSTGTVYMPSTGSSSGSQQENC